MNKIRLGLKALVAVAVIAAIMFAAPTIGRFVPTHKIVQPVFCASCHPEEANELAQTTHLGYFASKLQADDTTMPDAYAVSGACTMCHNFWENMKWFGVNNYGLNVVESDIPTPPQDIYHNYVSPYGLASTKAFELKFKDVEPWAPGLDVYEYNGTSGGGTDQHKRVDYVWSALSAKSPGPVNVTIIGSGNSGGCGTAEKGLCHISEKAVAMSAAVTGGSKKQEFPDINGSHNGAGVFFTHEMAYTTAQYAAKPVRLCGACHVFKLPPMKWGGEPWVGSVLQGVSTGSPFPGIGVDYNDMVGNLNINYMGDGGSFVADINYRTPDWAHQIVPCMRCHVHAGINSEGDTVSNT